MQTVTYFSFYIRYDPSMRRSGPDVPNCLLVRINRSGWNWICILKKFNTTKHFQDIRR
ncbi:hypothetical protein FHW67_002978 [Herbaspirillum sp. Sphag1AN]|nr:hypothetical protein [Herbaspirillum sp. Sphag1AN]MBB3246874.1 hypothetical protein [Herbaspirillum sp. Sphag64]